MVQRHTTASAVQGNRRDDLAVWAICPLLLHDERVHCRGVEAPLVDGCVGWMAARIVDEPELASKYDLFIAEGFAAWADDAVYDGARLRDDVAPSLRTVHHVAGGVYVVDGVVVRAR